MSATQPEGYLALPATGTGSPVLVLHPWWGLNDTIKGVCARLAEAGFVTFAPDLYEGKVTDQIDEAEKLVTELSSKLDQTRIQLAEALAFLKARAGAGDTGIAVVGFSMGAYYALDLSVNQPTDIRAVVLFYGTGPADFSQSKAAFLGHFAEQDPFEPQASVDELEGELKSAGRPVTFYTYPGTGHWFFEPDRADAYDEAAASLAWERTLTFLEQSAGA
ncbi:MAG: dienelactone hydrolase family protein [Anaerolineae bacterium]|nr:dienelactone hydrolase family protein [Anaerolineae bacterium]